MNFDYWDSLQHFESGDLFHLNLSIEKVHYAPLVDVEVAETSVEVVLDWRSEQKWSVSGIP